MTGSHPAPMGLRWLPSFLFRAEGWPGYVVRAWLFALLPSLAFAGLLSALVPDATLPDFGEPVGRSQKIGLAVSLVLVGPFVETLIMGGLLLPLNRLFGPTVAVLMSALLWGLLHSFGTVPFGGTAVPTWGLIVWWPFLIFSVAFLTWRKRGLAGAIGTVTVIHGMQNSVPTATLLAG